MRRRLALLLIVLVMAVVAGGALLASRGTYWSYPAARLETAAERQDAPTWTRACRPGHRGPTTRACVQVAGRVVWVQHHDPDGDGDRHLLVISRFHVRVVKVPAALDVPKVPVRGVRVLTAGFDLTGSHGDQEVGAERLTFGGRTYGSG